MAIQDPLSDYGLVRRWNEGDKASGSELINRHFDALDRFFRNKLFRDGADLRQLTFERICKHRANFRGESSFRTYLFSVAHHVLIDHLRKHVRESADFDLEGLADLGASPSSLVSRSREHTRLAQALREIPLKEQIVLELHYWEDCSMDEIAVILEIPPGTTRSRAQQGREKLLKKLSKSRFLARPVNRGTSKPGWPVCGT
ncbi:RNA polymerase sigma factor [Nannocystis pusilla]|uniref:RNA polymerase sigma factor n=1 Tax=Nannocystis pusilla TaxID=889268 RepID=A0A9X3EJU0_9BACT|nr:RNA polymerase sigma factor [Nannocystis pusilla]MCY1004500.1 RNA polymerase sigma factor [Nannocystis pusilla]